MDFDGSAQVDTAGQLALRRLRCRPRVGDVRCAALLHDFGSARAALDGLRADGAPADAAGAACAAEQPARSSAVGARSLPISALVYAARRRPSASHTGCWVRCSAAVTGTGSPPSAATIQMELGAMLPRKFALTKKALSLT